jgi:hypothetical protein
VVDATIDGVKMLGDATMPGAAAAGVVTILADDVLDMVAPGPGLWRAVT